MPLYEVFSQYCNHFGLSREVWHKLCLMPAITYSRGNLIMKKGLNSGNGRHRKQAMNEWTTQVASDVQRDGLGLELIRRGRVVAAVFRCDAGHSISVTCFEDGVPLPVFEWFLCRAREELGRSEDGTALPAAWDGPTTAGR